MKEESIVGSFFVSKISDKFSYLGEKGILLETDLPEKVESQLNLLKT